MIAYKFLGPGAVGLFSRLAWPVPRDGEPGEWVVAEGPLEVCRNGVHACRAGDLIDWIDSELWRVELGAPVIESAAGLVAPRGRLLSRVGEWDDAAAAALTRACVDRARDHAAEALERAGREGDADELRRLDDPEAIRERAPALARGASPEVADPLGFAADAVTMSRGSMPDTALLAELAPPTTAAIAANVAFTAARAAGRAHELAGGFGGFDGGYAAERAWQLGWLRDRLGIAGPGSPEGRSP
jgi:hypothetical protein